MVRPQQPPIESRIRLVRGRWVLPEPDLVELFRTTPEKVRALLRRNHARFPTDFCFLPNDAEADFAGHAFTEHGVASLSGLIRGKHVARMTVEILRAFARLPTLPAVVAEALALNPRPPARPRDTATDELLELLRARQLPPQTH